MLNQLINDFVRRIGDHAALVTEIFTRFTDCSKLARNLNVIPLTSIQTTLTLGNARQLLFLPMNLPHGFPWFMQGWAYNFCHISADGELLNRPNG